MKDRTIIGEFLDRLMSGMMTLIIAMMLVVASFVLVKITNFLFENGTALGTVVGIIFIMGFVLDFMKRSNE